MKTASTVKKKEKIIRKLKKTFGADIEVASTTEEEVEEVEEVEGDSKEEGEQGQETLELTQGLGEDNEEGIEEEKS